ncbi:hypothetical protein LTR64_002181 [Lithohypha guttulata]
MQSNVDVIPEHAIKAVNAGQKIVVVMHSYGRIPSCDPVAGLSYKERQANGLSRGVVHLFFMAAFIIPAGKTSIEALGGNDPPWWDISDDKMVVNPIDPGIIFYNDMTEEHVRKCISELERHSY